MKNINLFEIILYLWELQKKYIATVAFDKHCRFETYNFEYKAILVLYSSMPKESRSIKTAVPIHVTTSS
jgi:hypothetical protein